MSFLKKNKLQQPKTLQRENFKSRTILSQNKIFLFFIVLLVIFIVTPLQSQENLSTLKGRELHNKVRLNFIPVSMPIQEFPKLKPTMGLAGLHYQIPFNNWLYGGIAFHFATTGDQGGLFTLGTEIGINKKIYNNLYADANFHFGGGGGYRYLVNDGGFINPNIGLQYKKKNFSFGVQYSHINFYSGKIKDDAVSVFIEIPSILRFTDYKQAHKKFIANNLSSDAFWNTPPVKNAQQVRFDFFLPFGKSKKDDNSPLTETLYVIGFEYQKNLNKNAFLFIHTDAIYKGLRAGFMDLFFGMGYQPYQSKHFIFFTKLGIGAAGGRVAPEGGLMLYPSAGIDIKLLNNIAISTHAGYYRAIMGDLEAYTFGFGLKYSGLNGGAKTLDTKSTFHTQGIRAEIQNQTYFKVAKTDDIFNKKFVDLQIIGLKINYDLNQWLYIAGEAGFTYSGRSGGYAHGVIGGGVYSPKTLNNKVRGFIEFMAGAGGGAGIDTNEGVIIRPTLGISYDISDRISFLASAGKLHSPFGNVNANNINIGLSFNLSTLAVKK